MANARTDWPHRVFVWFERTVLSMGMTVLAVGVERVLVRAIKKGVEPAPRTAAGPAERPPPSGSGDRPEAEVGTSRPPV